MPLDRLDDYTSQRLAEYASSIYEANRHTLDPVVIKLTCTRQRADLPITGYDGPAAPSAMLPHDRRRPEALYLRLARLESGGDVVDGECGVDQLGWLRVRSGSAINPASSRIRA